MGSNKPGMGKDMLLAIDIGNTNFTVGVFKERELLATFRITTKLQRTSDEYGIVFIELIRTRGLSPADIEDVIISSVVPNVMHSVVNAMKKYFNRQPILVGPGIKTGIRLSCDNPREIGPDRIVDAVGAYELYGGPVIAMDFGTATTYDLILDEGVFTAGITSPGLGTSARSLWSDAAKLPEIEIVKPKSILAKNTVTSMQAGLVYGYIGQTEYIIKKIKEEAGIENIRTVATGGYGRLIAENTDSIQIYDSELTLKGLQLIYAKNR